jgi:hypothetical protein
MMETIQPDLNFETPAPSINTLNALVLEILTEYEWLMPWEIVQLVKKKKQVLISDSSATARLRDCRKAKYGSHVIEKRIRAGSRAFEYRLLK